MNQGVLWVKRQISQINGGVEGVRLKTKNAYRTLPLAADTLDVLKKQRKRASGSKYHEWSAGWGSVDGSRKTNIC